jgi:hypothetical protein
VDESVGSITTAVKYEDWEGVVTRLGSSGPARNEQSVRTRALAFREGEEGLFLSKGLV